MNMLAFSDIGHAYITRRANEIAVYCFPGLKWCGGIALLASEVHELYEEEL